MSFGPFLDLLSSFLLTGLMELGDASSLYLLGLALTCPRLAVFVGGVLAQVLVTGAAVCFGSLLPSDSLWISRVSTIVFFVFAVWSGYEAWKLADQRLEEPQEASQSLLGKGEKQWLGGCWKALVGTLVSEVGGKSQFMTCTLATQMNLLSVFVGAVGGVSFTMGVMLYSSQFLTQWLTPFRAYSASSLLFLASTLASLYKD